LIDIDSQKTRGNFESTFCNSVVLVTLHRTVSNLQHISIMSGLPSLESLPSDPEERREQLNTFLEEFDIEGQSFVLAGKDLS
jgi:hypothetical protein